LPYRYIEEEATADVAFEVWGKDLSTVFCDAGDALTNVMIENIEAIKPVMTRRIQIHNENLDLLLFNMLEELVYYKDTEQLLLRVTAAQVTQANEEWYLDALAKGEHLDPERHQQIIDIKAVTLHHFTLTQTGDGWRGHVILDI
jgi:SHS2 domain-containing protein